MKCRPNPGLGRPTPEMLRYPPQRAWALVDQAGSLRNYRGTMGLDGVILIAFILGFPANEIVVPIILMAYTAQSTLPDTGSLLEMKRLFLANGWSGTTALCTVLFSLMHWPCSTTLLTIRHETGSWRWTALAFALPTAMPLVSVPVTVESYVKPV